MRSDYYIYCWTCSVNGKQYIGKGLRDRYSSHMNPGAKTVLALAARKHGREAFTVEFLAKGLTENEAFAVEMAAIRDRKTIAPNGYNLTAGGEGASGCVRDAEYRKTKAAASRKMWETRDKEPLRQLQARRYADCAVREAQGKLTGQVVASIRFLYALGVPPRRISTRFELSQQHTSDICSRKAWDVELPPLSPEAEGLLRVLASELIEESRQLRRAAGMKGHEKRWGRRISWR